MTNRDIAARIVGYIRQAALGDALVPYELRVDRALARLDRIFGGELQQVLETFNG